MQDEQTMTEGMPSEQMLPTTPEAAQDVVPEPEEPLTEPIEDIPEDAPDELSRLRARIDELEAQLAERERLSERIGRECDEFASYFPEVSLRAVPDEVWGQVHAGIPLSAAYALYEKKQQKQQEAAERIGQRGTAMTAGKVGAAGEEYFSPAQVRAMSPGEVRANYDRIFESMRHWQ